MLIYEHVLTGQRAFVGVGELPIPNIDKVVNGKTCNLILLLHRNVTWTETPRIITWNHPQRHLFQQLVNS